MATATSIRVDYPTGDGKPMAETDLHWDVMVETIQALKDRYADDPSVYVSGNLLMFFVEGDPWKHVSPDAFVVKGVPKEPRRENYLIWEEGKAPDLVIEITSKSTRREDQSTKFQLYRDVLKVPEYFRFDPREEYLKPPLQGFRLVEGEYVRIEPVDGRLPSEELGLHLERDGWQLRFHDPETGSRLLTKAEQVEAAEADKRRAQADKRRAQADKRRAQADQRRSEAERKAALSENDRLRRELDELRRRLGDPGPNT